MQTLALLRHFTFLIGFLGSVTCFAGPAHDASDVRPFTFNLPVPQVEHAQPSAADEALLDRVREANFALYSDLQSFVCNEQIVRYRGYLDGSKGRQVDTVSAALSFENGIEQYSNVTQDGEQRAGMSSVGGAWSAGEFGTLLRQTEQLLGTSEVSFLEYSTVADTPTAIYSFDVSETQSPWELQIHGQHFPLAFRTVVWVSRSTGQILRLERTSISAPKRLGISEIRWSLSLKPTKMNGQTWLLPSTGEYAVLYRGADRREWNQMQFGNYRRYGSEVAIRFE